MQQCKDNANEARFILLEMKNNIELMTMKQGLYAQVFKLRRKDLKFIAANHNVNESKFKFQGLSVISQRWFDLDFDWIEVNFIKLEPGFYKKIFQSHDNTQDVSPFKCFQVPI